MPLHPVSRLGVAKAPRRWGTGRKRDLPSERPSVRETFRQRDTHSLRESARESHTFHERQRDTQSAWEREPLSPYRDRAHVCWWLHVSACGCVHVNACVCSHRSNSITPTQCQSLSISIPIYSILRSISVPIYSILRSISVL